jgi:hypothetical protein
MEATLLGEKGVATVDQRKAAMAGQGEGALGEYLRKVQAHAYKVTAEELKALQAKHSDDELFDLTLCAAYGATKQRHEAALKALDAAWDEA